MVHCVFGHESLESQFPDEPHETCTTVGEAGRTPKMDWVILDLTFKTLRKHFIYLVFQKIAE